ncbi:Uncharacterized protein FWK35_00022653 [Aphis craccivora]|uniref:Uncharacterized protein n=1 Tax=Aphis craccivora TaxID=307492 RepID=A0A6G0WQ53_APHCR|nr:Uncharacterized protein FWK35_00022653 [Aphis craccivora]
MNDQRQMMTHQACLILGILESLNKQFKNYDELYPDVKPANLDFQKNFFNDFSQPWSTYYSNR